MGDQVWTGADVKSWRAIMGWSQEEAAAELGISVRTMSNMENAETVDRMAMLACKQLYQQHGAASGGGHKNFIREMAKTKLALPDDPVIQAVALDIENNGPIGRAIANMVAAALKG